MLTRRRKVLPGSAAPARSIGEQLDAEKDVRRLGQLYENALEAQDEDVLRRLAHDPRLGDDARLGVLLKALVRPGCPPLARVLLAERPALVGALSQWLVEQTSVRDKKERLNTLKAVIDALARLETSIEVQLAVLTGAELLGSVAHELGARGYVPDVDSYHTCSRPGGVSCQEYLYAKDLARWRTSVHMALAQNGSTAGEVLDVLVLEGDATVKMVLAARGDVGPEALEALGVTGRAIAVAARAARDRGSRRSSSAVPEFEYAHTTLSALHTRLGAVQRSSVLLSAHLGAPLPPRVLDALGSATDETVRLVRLYDDLLSGPLSDQTHKVLAVVALQADAALTSYERFTEVLASLTVAEADGTRQERFDELASQVLGWAEVRSLGAAVPDAAPVPEPLELATPLSALVA